MLPITLNAFQYIIRVLRGKCRLHSAVGVEGVTSDFKVDLICGRWICAYVGCTVEVSKILTANQGLTFMVPCIIPQFL